MTDQRPNGYPKTSDLVASLLEDVQTVFSRATPDDLKWLKEKFHKSVRRHRHEQERFGKKWKRSSGFKFGAPSRLTGEPR